jgi:hypothetical protein
MFNSKTRPIECTHQRAYIHSYLVYDSKEKMKKTKMFQFLAILLTASLFAACGQAAITPTTSPNLAPVVSDAPVMAAPTDAPTITSSNAATSDACALLTNDEVSTSLGQTVVSAVSSGLGGVCTYTASNLKFDLTVSSTGGVKFVGQTIASLGDLAQIVMGLGDQAFFNTNSHALFVLKGDAVYLFDISDINYQPMDDAARQTMQTALAGQLVSHLP